MSQETLKEIYEILVKPLPAEERLRLLIMTARDLDAELAATSAQPRHNIMELHGLGKDVWEGIDAQDYINKLRDEWNPNR